MAHTALDETLLAMPLLPWLLAMAMQLAAIVLIAIACYTALHRLSTGPSSTFWRWNRTGCALLLPTPLLQMFFLVPSWLVQADHTAPGLVLTLQILAEMLTRAGFAVLLASKMHRLRVVNDFTVQEAVALAMHEGRVPSLSAGAWRKRSYRIVTLALCAFLGLSAVGSTVHRAVEFATRGGDDDILRRPASPSHAYMLLTLQGLDELLDVPLFVAAFAVSAVAEWLFAAKLAATASFGLQPRAWIRAHGPNLAVTGLVLFALVLSIVYSCLAINVAQMIGRGIFGVRLDDQQFGAQNAHWTVDLAISTLRFVPCLDAYLLIRVMVPRMRLLLRDVHNKAASNAREGSITSSLAPKRPKRPAESLSVLSRRGSEATLITGVQPSASATADRSGTASSLRAPSPTPSKSQVIAGHMRSTSLTPSASTPILISDPPPSALHPNRERRRESSGSWRDSDRAARGSFSATAAGEARTRSPAPSQHTSTRPSQQRTRSRSPSRSRTASQSVGRNGSMGRDGSMSMGRESAASSLNRNARLSGDEFSAFTASLDRDSSGRPYLSQGFSQGQGQSQSQPSSLGQGRYFGRQSWN